MTGTRRARGGSNQFVSTSPVKFPVSSSMALPCRKARADYVSFRDRTKIDSTSEMGSQAGRLQNPLAPLLSSSFTDVSRSWCVIMVAQSLFSPSDHIGALSQYGDPL